MQFVVIRLSDKQSQPIETARKAGETLFGDPVYVVDANSLDELMQLATRSKTSAPGDVGLIVWRRAPQSMSLPPELDGMPAVEIYDDIRG